MVYKIVWQAYGIAILEWELVGTQLDRIKRSNPSSDDYPRFARTPHSGGQMHHFPVFGSLESDDNETGARGEGDYTSPPEVLELARMFDSSSGNIQGVTDGWRELSRFAFHHANIRLKMRVVIVKHGFAG